MSNTTCSVNFKGLSYDHYKHVSLIQGVFEFTKGMFVDILNICLLSVKDEFEASGMLCGCYDESGEF